MSGEVSRVVQLNVDSIFGPKWPDRRVEVVTWLEELVADVVCLQEVWEDHRSARAGIDAGESKAALMEVTVRGAGSDRGPVGGDGTCDPRASRA